MPVGSVTEACIPWCSAPLRKRMCRGAMTCSDSQMLSSVGPSRGHDVMPGSRQAITSRTRATLGHIEVGACITEGLRRVVSCLGRERADYS